MGALLLIDNPEVVVEKSSLAPLAKDFQESPLSFLQLASLLSLDTFGKALFESLWQHLFRQGRD